MNLREQIELKIVKQVKEKISLGASDELKPLMATAKKIEAEGDALEKKINANYDILEKQLKTVSKAARELKILFEEMSGLQRTMFKYETDSNNWFIEYTNQAEELGLDFTESKVYKDMRKALDPMWEKWGEDGSGYDNGFEKAELGVEVSKVLTRIPGFE